VERRCSNREQRGSRDRGKICSPREKKRAQAHDCRSREVAGGGDRRRRGGDARDREQRVLGKRVSLWLGSAGWRPFFKTRHGRTGQSTVPVRCTPDSAQENWILARGCRCTGHCTVQCPVHTGLSGEPRKRGVWKILNFSI
jgi:hypothetical protein